MEFDLLRIALKSGQRLAEFVGEVQQIGPIFRSLAGQRGRRRRGRDRNRARPFTATEGSWQPRFALRNCPRLRIWSRKQTEPFPASRSQQEFHERIGWPGDIGICLRNRLAANRGSDDAHHIGKQNLFFLSFHDRLDQRREIEPKLITIFQRVGKFK